MKTKFSLLLVLFAFMAITSNAQTASTEKPQEEQVWVPDKVIAAAEHYEGGKEAMYKFIKNETKYPPLAKRNRIQGEAIISFTLNDDGSTSGFKILKNPGGGTGEEALRVAKLIKFKAPGYSQVTSLPILFKL
ncbi:energy transducer TonB [Pontibacter sp. SGAir0037]|uniref:energy transducer TonB n=1 Tax=Pontibacter sp. SGAir0037 TaxID=2571030 RepID=UPI0010CD4FFE|nr:energy transducer TonB [Pontibacter sp. SGAir0037]QCR23304.1 energy transducer TonB [Pontibacter sp. SGAir0037]